MKPQNQLLKALLGLGVLSKMIFNRLEQSVGSSSGPSLTTDSCSVPSSSAVHSCPGSEMEMYV